MYINELWNNFGLMWDFIDIIIYMLGNFNLIVDFGIKSWSMVIQCCKCDFTPTDPSCLCVCV